MSLILQNSLIRSNIFNQFESVSDKKNLCNVTIYCSNGIFYQNKLVVGLVFPVLEKMETFNMMPELVVILPGFSVQQVKNRIEQYVRKQLMEKSAYDDKIIEDILGENESSNENENVTPTPKIQFITLTKIEDEEFDEKGKAENEEIKDIPCDKNSNSESIDDSSTENKEFDSNIKIKIENNVATKVEEEEEFLKLVKYISDTSKVVDGSDGSLLKCNLCEKSYKTGRVSRHVSGNHCTTEYQCPLCDYFRGNRKEMRMHINKTHEEMSQKDRKGGYCSICKKNVSKLSDHTKRVHLKLRQHPCNLCGIEFYDKHDLKKHIRKVHEGKREICPECGLSFKRIHEHIRVVHRREITKEVCPHCGKSYSQVKEHIRSVHENERNFSCHLCPLKTFTNATLKTHLQVHERYASMNKIYTLPPKPEYKYENMELATGLVATGKMSRRKAAKMFQLSVHEIKKATQREKQLQVGTTTL